MQKSILCRQNNHPIISSISTQYEDGWSPQASVDKILTSIQKDINANASQSLFIGLGQAGSKMGFQTSAAPASLHISSFTSCEWEMTGERGLADGCPRPLLNQEGDENKVNPTYKEILGETLLLS